MNKHQPSITIKQARILLDGIQRGEVDEYDLASIFEWGTDWLADSDTECAAEARKATS